MGEREMQRSEATWESLEGKRAGLARDLRNVEQIEDKIASEMAELKEQLGTMREELVVYSDTDRLTRDIRRNVGRLRRRSAAAWSARKPSSASCRSWLPNTRNSKPRCRRTRHGPNCSTLRRNGSTTKRTIL